MVAVANSAPFTFTVNWLPATSPLPISLSPRYTFTTSLSRAPDTLPVTGTCVCDSAKFTVLSSPATLVTVTTGAGSVTTSYLPICEPVAELPAASVAMTSTRTWLLVFKSAPFTFTLN
ncbi:hypothetical protein BWP33_05695 [Simonsiella muelleri ATCC 29453]|nr:hypothetical protein [Simonsiella muelleri]AUX61350.1 hypothetical protein BWP33_05695 [Simonsiella muelleri ATCC 29453]